MSDFQSQISSLLAKWFACRVTSGKVSALYGLRLSSPLFISLVVIGILFTNLYFLSFTLFIAILGVLLPMHPFDYIYNFIVKYLPKVDQIRGRGTEMQVSSAVAVLFNLIVVVLINYEVDINYTVLAVMYTLFSVLFISLQLKRK